MANEPECWRKIDPDTMYGKNVEVGRWIKKGVWVLTHLQSPAPGWSLIYPNDYYTHFRRISPPEEVSH